MGVNPENRRVNKNRGYRPSLPSSGVRRLVKDVRRLTKWARLQDLYRERGENRTKMPVKGWFRRTSLPDIKLPTRLESANLNKKKKKKKGRENQMAGREREKIPRRGSLRRGSLLINALWIRKGDGREDGDG